MSFLVTALRRAASLDGLRGSRAGAFLSARGARLLIDARRLDEADALLARAIAAHPRDPGLAAVHADAAQARGDHREAVVRWEKARRLGAEEPFATSRLAASLRLAGEPEAARALVDDELARAPDDFRLLVEAARLAQERDDPQAAVSLWRRAIRRAKPHADWLQGYGLSLLRVGDLDRAARIVASARRQYPDFDGLIATEGWIANARQDWALAIGSWSEYRRRAPNDATSWEALGVAMHGAQMGRIAGDPVPVKADITPLDDEPMRRLLLNFESLGDSCEMGLVQRRFGAEPLSLLRWNDVALDNLIAALGHRFDGLGEPDNTMMETASSGELYLRDRRWDLTMHTFLRFDRVDPADVYKKMCRRIVYLREKLLEDMRIAEKVFVYRSDWVDADGLRRLHDALCAHGAVTLLGVQPVLTPVTAFPGRPVGAVERLGEGLYVGFLAEPASPMRADYNIDFDAWTSVFTKVLDAIRGDATADHDRGSQNRPAA